MKDKFDLLEERVEVQEISKDDHEGQIHSLYAMAEDFRMINKSINVRLSNHDRDINKMLAEWSKMLCRSEVSEGNIDAVITMIGDLQKEIARNKNVNASYTQKFINPRLEKLEEKLEDLLDGYTGQFFEISHLEDRMEAMQKLINSEDSDARTKIKEARKKLKGRARVLGIMPIEDMSVEDRCTYLEERMKDLEDWTRADEETIYGRLKELDKKVLQIAMSWKGLDELQQGIVEATTDIVKLRQWVHILIKEREDAEKTRVNEVKESDETHGKGKDAV